MFGCLKSSKYFNLKKVFFLLLLLGLVVFNGWDPFVAIAGDGHHSDIGTLSKCVH